ncbi:phosphotransferase family protein [Nonomuraea wenchangensis]|uniref:phosphotransferase family protein n=1 Tax=Nonomuraea wenchangensis TaxID=568860 RepID=UPI0034253124
MCSNQEEIGAWLVRTCGLVAPLTHEQIAGGLSNVTTLVTDATGRQVVVRRPPSGSHTGGAHDVLREARIMRSLAATDVPVPAVVAACDDDAIAGRPFYVMEHVRGTVVDSPDVLAKLRPEARWRLGLELMDLLAALQHVDVEAVGLSELRRSTPYLDRQLRRWKSQWAVNATRSLPIVDRVTERLEKVLPTLPARRDRLVHGDFRFGNVMIGSGGSPRVEALLDWELATTGHPLADLGFVGGRMSAPDGVLAGDADPSSAAGCPDFETLVRRFESLTGEPAGEVPVFVALSAWRWAIIVEGVHKRFAAGRMGEVAEDADWHRSRVELLARLALDWLDR